MKKIWNLLLLVVATVIITGSCDKEDPQGGNNEDQINTPKVTTGEVTNIKSTTAACSGNVKADGGATITARGVCWSTAENPTTSDSKTTDGTGKGTYTSNLTELSPNTQYYARAYATNSKGTAYGEQRAFKTVQGLPEVTTGEVTSITTTTATCSGDVKADGGTTVTARGVCWSTSENPTTSDSKTTDGTGMGTYTSNLIDLSPDTQYYVRAYATNSKGTAYGEQRAFKTQDELFTDSRDGKVYKYVTIGNQVWMAENLAYLPAVSPPTTYSYSSSNYYVYGYEGTDVKAAKEVVYYITYGVLYNWPAATRACPEGWHLPSKAEWEELTNYLGGSAVAGGKMKEKGYAHWREPNEGATNESGFTALPGGRRCGILEKFQAIENVTYFWSSSEGTGSHVWYWILNYDNARVGSNDYFKDNGFSVRCIRD
ncbi:MAG: FISUMP domain-containing protein [Bacteroidales bacterium]|nr:FISUMP domain-containing protein [Bacteroidales bacterium]